MGNFASRFPISIEPPQRQGLEPCYEGIASKAGLISELAMNDDVRALVAEGADYVRAALRELEKELETARWKGDDEERGKRRIQRGKQPHNIWYPKRSGKTEQFPKQTSRPWDVGDQSTHLGGHPLSDGRPARHRHHLMRAYRSLRDDGRGHDHASLRADFDWNGHRERGRAGDIRADFGGSTPGRKTRNTPRQRAPAHAHFGSEMKSDTMSPPLKTRGRRGIPKHNPFPGVSPDDPEKHRFWSPEGARGRNISPRRQARRANLPSDDFDSGSTSSYSSYEDSETSDTTTDESITDDQHRHDPAQNEHRGRPSFMKRDGTATKRPRRPDIEPAFRRRGQKDKDDYFMMSGGLHGSSRPTKDPMYGEEPKSSRRNRRRSSL